MIRLPKPITEALAEDGRRTASLPYIKRVADAALGGPEL